MDLQASASTQSDRQLVSTRSQLPEFSCTLKPASSFESSITNTDDEERTPSSIPTPEQEAAITVLKDVEEDKVIAWLTLLRSIEPGFQLRSGPGCLSSEQIDSLNTLKDCHNGNVLAWLRYDLLADNVNVNKQLLERKSYGSSRSASKRSITSISRATRKSSARSSLRSSISSFGPSSPYSSATAYSSPRSSLGQASLFNLEEDEHTHWCTYGEHKNPITTCDGWKRHEKEHETVYACMPHGPLEDLGLGPQCVFCGLRRPSPSHLQEHRAYSCAGPSKEPLTRTRKPNMVKHLATHGISSDDASMLAERWRYTPNKNAFSCGFCVKLFASLTDRLNHIDHEHWSHGQVMDQWSLTNVIRGLLLQPKVTNAWQHLLASHPTLLECNLSWELPTAEGLQLRLETGEECGQDLALAAFQLRANNANKPRQGYTTPIAVSAEQQMDLDSNSDFQDVAHAALTSTTSLTSNATFAQRSASVSRHPPVSPLNNVNTSRLDFCGSQFPQPSQTALFKSPFATEDSLAGLPTHSAPFSDTNGHMLQQSCPFFASSTRTQPLNPGFHPSCNSHDRDHLNTNGASLIDQYIDAGQALSTFASAGTGLHHGIPRPEQLDHYESASMPASPSVDGNTGSQMNHDFETNSRQGKPLPALPLPPQDFENPLNIQMESDFDSDFDIF